MTNPASWVRRIPVYLSGLFLMTAGVNLSVLSRLGVSPIDTIPYVVSLISGKSLGLCTTLVFSVYIALQIVILRRDFQWHNLFQLVIATIFGWFVTLSGQLTALLPAEPGYLVQLLYMLCSIAFLGTGIFLYVAADILNMPADAVALALSFRTGRPMSTTKIWFDWTVVAVSVALSLGFLGGVNGIREGTLVAAFGVGLCIRFWERRLTEPLRRFLFP